MVSGQSKPARDERMKTGQVALVYCAGLRRAWRLSGGQDVEVRDAGCDAVLFGWGRSSAWISVQSCH